MEEADYQAQCQAEAEAEGQAMYEYEAEQEAKAKYEAEMNAQEQAEQEDYNTSEEMEMDSMKQILGIDKANGKDKLVINNKIQEVNKMEEKYEEGSFAIEVNVINPKLKEEYKTGSFMDSNTYKKATIDVLSFMMKQIEHSIRLKLDENKQEVDKNGTNNIPK